MAARYKAWLYVQSLAGTAGSNPAGGMDMSRFIVVCCQLEVCGRADHSSRVVLTSVVYPTECDRETSQRKPRRTTAAEP